MYYIHTEPGIRLAVHDLNPTGRQAVLLIHGWPLNHKMFEYQLNVLPEYGFRCIAVDLRGFGESDAPWAGYDYDRLSDDILSVISTLNLPRLTLAGFSMGGAVAIRYMARHKGYKVGKLALISAAAPSFTQRESSPYGLPAEQVNALIAHIYKDRPQAIHDFGQSFFSGPVSESFAGWFDRLSTEGPGHSTIQTAITLRDADLSADLPQISVPTGIFHGIQDKICPYPFAQIMNRDIPNSTLYPFEHSGHGVFYQELKKFNQELIEFLKK